MKVEGLIGNKKFLIGLAACAVLLLVTLLILISSNNDDKNDDGVSEDWYAKDAEEDAREYIEKYPAITKLPIRHAMYLDGYYDETEFRIDGGWFEGCKSEFCIKITDETHNSYEKAYQALRDNGINPDDYEIIYEYKILTK